MEGKHLLILSLLDLTREPNGRIHHLVAHARRAWDHVTVVHGIHPARVYGGASLLTLARFSVRAYGDGNLRRVAVLPLLNTPEYLARQLAGYPDGMPGFRGRLRRGAEAILSALAIGRDAAVIASLFAGLLARGRGPFDACIAQCPLTGAVGLLARGTGLVRSLLYDDIDYAPGACAHRPRRAWIRWLEGVVMRRADRVVCCGSLLAERREGELGRKVPVITNGVDEDLFRAARARVPHAPTLVYMGRVLEWAGLEVVLAALPAIRQAIPGVRCLILGRADPGYLTRLGALVRDLGLDDAVRFEGEVPYRDLPRFLRTCDVGLATFRPHPMKRYAFPLKVVEYMAAGLPVIGTEDSETERIIRAAGCGEVVTHDAAAVARAAVSLLSDPDRYARLAENAATASTRFAWDSLLGEVDSHLREMVEARGSAPGGQACQGVPDS